MEGVRGRRGCGSEGRERVWREVRGRRGLPLNEGCITNGHISATWHNIASSWTLLPASLTVGVKATLAKPTFHVHCQITPALLHQAVW